MAREFSLAYLTIPGIDPIEQIKIAREAGYDYVSLRTIPMGLPGEPQVRLESDPELKALIRQTLKDTHMKLLDIELLRIREDLPADHRAAFEQGAELGATQILSSVWTPDRSFAIERCGAYCEQAAEFGLTVNLEFPVVSSVTSLDEALEIQAKVGAPNLKILSDMIYLHLDGVTPGRIKSVPAGLFGLIHLCDWPGEADAEMVQLVREGRAYCGEGVADLQGFLTALPPNPCSIELPNAKRIAELGPLGHARRCLEAARACFERFGL